MSIISGFNLFNLNNSQNINDKWQVFCNHYMINRNVPLLYEAYKTFEFGRNKFKENKLFHSGFNFNIDFLELKFFGNLSDFIGLYDIVSLEESIESMKNAFPKDDEIHGMQLAYLGDCIDNKALLVGIGNNNTDKIFLECSDLFPSGERIISVADNIFDFIKNLALVEKETIGLGLSTYNQIYKNWNEDFWRVRDAHESHANA